MKKIYHIIKDWKKEAKYEKVIQFKYDYKTHILTLYVAYPGYLIGRAGNLYNKYIEILNKEGHNVKEIKFEEVNPIWI